MEEVQFALAPDEPVYTAIADRLGIDAAPFLVTIAAGEDLGLAAKAASLAAYLPVDVAEQIIANASRHPYPAVRVAAAAALHVLGTAADEPAGRLLADADFSVRSWTLRSLERTVTPLQTERVAQLAETDPMPAIRELAARIATR